MGWQYEIAGGAGGGAGFRRGPAQNDFPTIAARDAYTADPANAAWLTTYNGDEFLVVTVTSGGTTNFYNRSNNAWQEINGLVTGPQGLQGPPGQGALNERTQVAHSFVAADIGKPLYLDPDTDSWQLAQADDDESTSRGVLFSIVDANTIQIESMGDIELTDWSNVTQDSSGTLEVGETYYVSTDQPGKIIAESALSAGDIANPIYLAVTTTRANTRVATPFVWR